MSKIVIGSPSDKKGITVIPSKIMFNENNVKKMMKGNDVIWIAEPIALIPIMTSNTTPSGVASASSFYGDRYPYKAFNGVLDTSGSNSWCGSEAGIEQWLMYQFETAKIVQKIEMCAVANGSYVRCKNFKFQASNDGTSFVDLMTGVYPNDTSLTKHEFIISNSKPYKYYRVNISDVYDASNVSCGLSHLQMYGY